jgi:hypothetical protein
MGCEKNDLGKGSEAQLINKPLKMLIIRIQFEFNNYINLCTKESR